MLLLGQRQVEGGGDEVGQFARVLDRFNDWFDRTADGYKLLIGWALDHRKTVVLAATGAFFAGLAFFFTLQSEFFPLFDRGEFNVWLERPLGSSLAQTQESVAAVEASLRELPEVKFFPIDTPDRQNGWYVMAFSLDIEKMTCNISQFVDACGAEGGLPAELALVRRHADALPTIGRMVRSGFNAPLSSGVGRLFDAAAAVLGIRHYADYEGQAAIELEHLDGVPRFAQGAGHPSCRCATDARFAGRPPGDDGDAEHAAQR